MNRLNCLTLLKNKNKIMDKITTEGYNFHYNKKTKEFYYIHHSYEVCNETYYLISLSLTQDYLVFKYDLYPYIKALNIIKQDQESTYPEIVTLIKLPLYKVLTDGENLKNTLKDCRIEDNKEEIVKYIYEHIRNKGISFKTNKIKEEEKDEKSQPIYVKIFRKLIHDFIFDWEVTDLFENSEHFAEIESRLRSNYYFYAISSKFLYDYYNLIFDEKKAEVFLKKSIKYGKQYLLVLNDSRVNELYKLSHWFKKDIEDEYSECLEKIKKNISELKGIYKREKISREIESKEDFKRKIESLNNKIKELKKTDNSIYTDAIKWFSRRYSLGKLFTLISKDVFYLFKNIWIRAKNHIGGFFDIKQIKY